MTTAPAGNRYGMRGGNWLPPPPKDDAAFAKAVAEGYIVLARCECQINGWWIVAHRLGRKCHACGVRYVEAA